MTIGPREYLKIKYAAPTGACKCGNCQLVPPERLAAWAQQIEAYELALQDILNPVGELRRNADAQGARLNGMAYSIGHSASNLQRLAHDALSSFSTAECAKGE